MGIKTIIISLFRLSNCFDGNHSKWGPKNSQNSHVLYPSGKPNRYLRLLCTQELCQGFAVNVYCYAVDDSITLDALDLRHPRLLQR